MIANPVDTGWRSHRGVGVAIATIMCGALAGVGSVYWGAAILIVIVAVFISIVIVARPVVAIHATIICGFLATPTFVPYYTGAAGISVYLYQPFLYFSALYAIRSWKQNPIIKTSGVSRFAFAAVLIFGISVLFSTIVGVARGFMIWDVVSDLRGLIDMMLAGVVGFFVIRTPVLRPYLWTLWATVTTSAAVVVAASLFGLTLNGRTEDATLYRSSGGILETSGAVRYLTPATTLAVACVCGAVALYFSGSLKLRTAVAYLVPALTLCVLSYSRNQLVAIAVAIAFVCIANLLSGAYSVFIFRVAMFTVTVLGCFVLARYLVPGLFRISWIQTQLDGYVSRVIDGLNPAVRAADGSVNDRMIEDRFMAESTSRYWWIGSGYGYAYKPSMGTADSFAADRGRFYAHNFYLWLAMKGGWLSIGSFLIAAVSTLLGTVRARCDVSRAWAMGAILAGCLAMNSVAPLPLGFPSALLFGGVMGCAMGSVFGGQSRSFCSSDLSQALHKLEKVS